MASVAPSDLAQVLQIVQTWPADMQLALAHKILETVENPANVPEKGGVRRGKPVEALIGIGAGTGTPPTDEEVRRWIAEYRTEKHGR